jgi:hypothetical protein
MAWVAGAHAVGHGHGRVVWVEIAKVSFLPLGCCDGVLERVACLADELRPLPPKDEEASRSMNVPGWPGTRSIAPGRLCTSRQPVLEGRHAGPGGRDRG